MRHSNPVRKAQALAALVFLTSCAHSPGSMFSKVDSHTRTPSQVINSYAYEGQRKELDLIIEEAPVERPAFLQSNIENKKVDFWVNYFSNREKARFERFLKNGSKYRKTIERIFDDYGLPKELFYVGLIESGYYLGAKSHAGAVGPWQFIRATAKRYGLKVRGGIDERRSIVKATEAAALYFQDLYNIFGNWELALSAYNAGEYGVVRRIRKAKTRDYYELSARKVLPKETRHYVPKVLAVMKILKNPSKYGVRTFRDREDIYEKAQVAVIKRQVNLNTLAKRTGISKSTILAMNPDIYWKSVPYVRGGFKLFLPNNDGSEAIAKINKGPRKIASSHATKGAYKVQRGDNLISIASRHGVSLSEIMEANNIRNASHIRIGQRLVVPGDEEATENYRVRRGDNLYELARTHHTSISTILKLNGLSKRTIYVGQKLRLPKVTKEIYTVRRGDYLLKIAKKHGTTVQELKKLNAIKSKIYPGQKLVVSVN